MIGKMKILVGLSWGVDSAVAAYLLKEQGHEVVAGFMKNYVSEEGNCTTYQDSIDAIKVAEYLWIEIRAYDLQKEYQEKIIDYIFEGYQRGITPNPDVLCNSLIKFDVFLQKALAEGFDKIATGHYAQLLGPGEELRAKEKPDFNPDFFHLLRGVDEIKDQSYFLSWLDQFQLSKSLFPLWAMKKPEVRDLAERIGLPNAKRRDSQGLCFIWNIPIREFLMKKLPPKSWAIKTLDGKKVWEHQGAYYFTIGQKQGLGLNFKAYVYRIDIAENTVYVCDKDAEQLQSRECLLKDWHWIAEEYPVWSQLSGKIRYRQNPPVACEIIGKQWSDLQVRFQDPQWAVAPGQVFVLYDGEVCLWGGIIS